MLLRTSDYRKVNKYNKQMQIYNRCITYKGLKVHTALQLYRLYDTVQVIIGVSLWQP